MGTLGPMELALIAGVALLLFGPHQIQLWARGLGRAWGEAQASRNEMARWFQEALKVDTQAEGLGQHPLAPPQGPEVGKAAQGGPEHG